MYTVCTTVQDSTTLSKPSAIRNAFMPPATWRALASANPTATSRAVARPHHHQLGDGRAGSSRFANWAVTPGSSRHADFQTQTR